ncbi:amino acid adenylation domain-containing protein [Streptomyces similanensis]
MTATDHRRTTGAQSFPPSPAQAGLWFASTYGTDPTAYSQPLVLRLDTLLDHGRLQRALRLVHREDCSLRTTFDMDADGELRQLVHEELEPILDVRDHTGDAADAWVAEQVAEIAATVFDLRRGPLARVRHLRLRDEGRSGRSVLVFDIHHTVFDGLSWKPYLTRLETAYTRGPEHPGTPRRQAVEAYARWAERWQASGSLPHWLDKLAAAPAAPPLALPGEGPERHVTRQRVLDDRLTDRVRRFCAAEGVTTSMFFAALTFLLLHRQTRRDDLLLGIPVTVRDGGDADVLGHLTNTVVLRHRLTAGASARDVLHAVKRDMLDALRHRHVPLEVVVGELRSAHGGKDGVGDLFNAMLTVMPAAARSLDLRAWGARTWEHVSGGAKYELAVLVDETPGHYALVVEHTSAAPAAERFAAHLAGRLETLVRGVLAGPDTDVRRLNWVSQEEEREVAARCARRQDAPTLGAEVTADLFADTVTATPADPAVVADGTVTSYAELARRVDAVAAGLAARGVRDGRPVAVLMRPGLDLVTTVTGILRAGGSYVVLDPDQPPGRLAFTLADCGARILLHAPDADLTDVPLPDGTHTATPAGLDGGAAPAPGLRKSPDDQVYVVYTSGSTGRPKGVVLREPTLTNLVHNQAVLSEHRRMRTLQYMPPAFDVFSLEVFGTLCTGGTLIVPPAHARTDFAALAALLAEQRVERAYFPYVALRELAAVLRSSATRLPDLREVYVTGERLVITEELREMFRRHPEARLINAYGPSEAHLVSAETLPADPDAWPAIPSIGRVVAGLDARVLLDGDEPAPFGVEGELCVAGPVVSPGYIGLPDKTRRAMVPDPFVPGQLMYRTGDLVVLDPDGRLHYRGRADDQVKIRGYRVEPGEIEAALEGLPHVEAAAVVVVPAGQDHALHAFVRGGQEPPPDWRARLAAVLPGYMVPHSVTRLDTFPVTPNGKTDRRALAARPADPAETDPAAAGPAATESAADDPADWTDRERAVAALWRDVLGHAPATPDDDFFEQGGHSLLAARLHRLVRERLDADVPLSVLLGTPTVRGMAAGLTGGGATQPPDLRAEARLHDLVIGERRAPADGPVLLTGATGFLGSHLLDELLRTGRRVICLVRADSVTQGRERLRAAFEKFALDPSGLDRTGIWPGDLARPRLGLGDAFETRAGEVAEVYHAAAHINFVVPYPTVKRTNVDGLRHLLDFCAAHRTPLRLISTLGVFPPDATTGVIGEDTVPGDPASLGIGYSQSKWVAEQLAAGARRAGLPVTVYRVGRIAGHSRTGACRHDDFFWLQMKAFASLGRCPDDIADAPAVDLLPVDYVAHAIVRLAENGPDDANWHLYHAQGLAWPAILDTIRAQGYAVEPAAPSAWLAALERQVETDAQGQGLGPLVPLMREGVMRLGSHTFDNTRTMRAAAEAGCPCPPADTEWIRQMFAYFRANGSVPPPDGVTLGGHDG